MRGVAIAALLLASCSNAHPNPPQPNQQATSCPDDLFFISGDTGGWDRTVRDWENYQKREVSDLAYKRVKQLLTCVPAMRPEVAAAYSDRKITHEEFDALKLKMWELRDQQKLDAAKSALSRALEQPQ